MVFSDVHVSLGGGDLGDDPFPGRCGTSLDMSPDERRRRMRRMRRQLHNSTIFDWLDSILARATAIMSQQHATV